jgi:hypothetical protein
VMLDMIDLATTQPQTNNYRCANKA